ncbi:BTAD domain-containing putative transcriptional regulator [Streptomyces sp. NPDC023723]|uniref:AfsR/SARP family transcriptional regulator n=1 Tax=Streptomyces sp. NPDC023723 TaxID=3154323 RepID=UPI0033F8C123
MTLSERLLHISAPRLQATLGALLLRANEIVTVDYLIESIWEDSPPSNPSNQVATCISMLRRKFRDFGVPGEILATQPPGYRFITDEVNLDTYSALRLRSEAQDIVAKGGPAQALPILHEALSLWRGPTLSGFNRRIWAPEIQRWEEEYVSLRRLRSEIQLHLHHYDDLIAELSVFIQQYPLLEQSRATLMIAFARSGRQADALQIYRDTDTKLREELGVAPGHELQQLHEQILRGSLPPVVADSIPITLQTGNKSPLPVQYNSAPKHSAAKSVPCQLPGDLAEFVGREGELAAVQAAIASDAGSVSLVLLAGPGGTGKTALAVHAAHLMRAVFCDGQLYINLRGMSGDPVTPAEALGRFLRELGMPGPVPESLDERADSYRSLLADRRMLILLDDAADAAQVIPLLPGTNSSAVLVTSRSRLTAIPATQVLELDVFQRRQALALLSLLVGNHRVESDPATAHQLVEYCGRLPLAVRILGAKLASKPHWTLRKAAARLSDEHRRLDELKHDNLEVRASLELSHQGISPAARQLFRRIALVTTSDFAEWVCAPLTELPLHQAEDLLEELLDARLIDVVSSESAGELRYRMHDLVRLYALEQAHELEPQEQRTAALIRLGMTTLALADRAHRAVCGGDFTVLHNRAQPPSVMPDVLERIARDPLAWYEADRLMLSALCQRLADQGQDELAWDLASTARCQFSLRFHFDEWRTTHEAALRASRLHGNERGAAAMLLGLGDLHLTRRDYSQAVPLLEEAHQLFQKVGDRYGYALALRKAAAADRVQGCFDRALSRWEECLPILREAGDIEAQAQVLRWSGQTLLEIGQPEEGGALLREAEQVVDGFGGRSVAQVRLALGGHYLVLGEFDQAGAEFGWSLKATDSSGDLSARTYALWGLGCVALLSERRAEGENHLRQAQALAQSIHDPLLESDILLALAASRYLARKPDEAFDLLEQGKTLCRNMNASFRLKQFEEALADLSQDVDPVLFSRHYCVR